MFYLEEFSTYYVTAVSCPVPDYKSGKLYLPTHLFISTAMTSAGDQLQGVVARSPVCLAVAVNCLQGMLFVATACTYLWLLICCLPLQSLQ